MNCPLCDTYLQNRADTSFFKCPCCGAYVKDKTLYIDAAKEKAVYEKHHNDVNDIRYQKFTAPITDLLLENFTPEHLGLDYGCGTGPVIAKMLSDRSYQITCYDPFFYPSEAYLDQQYDFIYSCEVFEHFHQPKQEIQKLLSLLKPGGWLLVMTHIFDEQTRFENWYYRLDHTHVFIYTPKTLNFIASHFNLKVVKLGERLVVFENLVNG